MDKIHRCIIDVEPVDNLDLPLEKSQFPLVFKSYSTLIQQLEERPRWFLDIQSPYAMYASCSAFDSTKVEFLVNAYSEAFVQDYLV